MAAPNLITIAALGAGAYLLYDQVKDSNGSLTPPVPKAIPAKSAATVKSSTDRVIAAYLKRHPDAAAKARENGRATGTSPANEAGNGGSQSGLPADVERQILDDLKRSWDQATGEAKIAVCQRMKAQFPNDPGIQAINCADAPNMAFQLVVTTVGAAIGGAVCGPPCSVVGALVAAWAGPTLEEWATAAWDKVKDWGEELWPGNWF